MLNQRAIALLLLPLGVTIPHSTSAEIMFSQKTFFDADHIVHVEGTLTGEGIGYPTNLTILTCYQVRMVCTNVNIQTEGMLVFPVDLPIEIPVTVWTSDHIIADQTQPCGNAPDKQPKQNWQKTAFSNWIIDRTKQTVEVTERGCLDAKTYHWSVEDPAYWKMQRHH